MGEMGNHKGTTNEEFLRELERGRRNTYLLGGTGTLSPIGLRNNPTGRYTAKPREVLVWRRRPEKGKGNAYKAVLKEHRRSAENHFLASKQRPTEDVPI